MPRRIQLAARHRRATQAVEPASTFDLVSPPAPKKAAAAKPAAKKAGKKSAKRKAR